MRGQRLSGFECGVRLTRDAGAEHVTSQVNTSQARVELLRVESNRIELSGGFRLKETVAGERRHGLLWSERATFAETLKHLY